MAVPTSASLVEPFQTGEDPRIEWTKKHPLLDILVIAVCTLLTGGEGCQDIERCGKSQRAWLQTFLALPNGIPSHDTLGRVLARLNPERFHQCFVAWTHAVAQLTQGPRISRDGQPVQASFDRATALAPLPMHSAGCADNGGLVVGPMKTETTSNEITAIPELLHWLAIQGCIGTIEAMGWQTAIAGQLRDQGGADLLAGKKHHKKASTASNAHLPQPIEPYLPWRNADNFFAAFNNAHGRRIRRRGWVMPDLAALPARTQGPGLQAVMAVETMRMAHKQAPVTRDYRFDLSSLPRSGTACVTMMRQHCDIEPKLHWSLAVTGNADRCRIRQEHAPEHGVAVRHLALNLLRQESSHRISRRQKRRLCSLDEHDLLTGLCRAT